MGNLGMTAGVEILRSIDSVTFTGNYQALGTPLLNPAVLIRLINNSTSDVTGSVNGSDDFFFLPKGSFVLLDIGSNKQSVSNDQRLYIRQGTQFYVKGAAGVGSVYLEAIYVLH